MNGCSSEIKGTKNTAATDNDNDDDDKLIMVIGLRGVQLGLKSYE